MSMKKGITFIATLLILACVVFTVNGAWAASATPTMKQEDVIVYNKGDATQPPYTKVSRENRTFYYEGTGYSGKLGNNDITVTAYKYISAEDRYQAVEHLPVPTESSENKCEYTNGTVKGKFTILPNDFDRLLVPDQNGDRIVKLEVFIVKGMDAPKTFWLEINPPDDGPLCLPQSNSVIHNFFVASVNTAPTDTLQPPVNPEDRPVCLWMEWRVWDVPATTAYKLKAKSDGFGDPASVLFDPLAHQSDLRFTWRDESGLSRRETAQDVSFGADVDAETEIAEGAQGPVFSVKIVPPAGFDFATVDNTFLNIDGEIIPQLDSEWEMDGEYAVLTVEHDAIDAFKWGAADQITIGVDTNDAIADNMRSCERYFGVVDGSGPVLLQALVDEDNDRTLLIFNEPLDKAGSLSCIEVFVNNAWKAYAGKASYSTANNNMVILPEELTGNIRVGYFDPAEVNEEEREQKNIIRDLKGNRVIQPSVDGIGPLTGMKVESVAVTGVNQGTTAIEVTFSGPMMDDPGDDWLNGYFDVKATPEMFDLPDPENTDPATICKDTDGDGVLDTLLTDKITGVAPIVDNDTYVRRVLLTIDERIKDTSESGLPKVMISEDGMKAIKGETGALLIADNKGVASKDKVGPYILSASYNRNPEGKQLLEDELSNHVLTVTFSEPIQCGALYFPSQDFDILSADAEDSDFGRHAETSPRTGYASSIKIQMGENCELGDVGCTEVENVVPLDEGNDRLQIRAGKETNFRDKLDNSGATWIDDLPNTPAMENPRQVTVEDGTTPWIVSVKTVDRDIHAGNNIGNGQIEALELTWNEDIEQWFDEPKGIVSVLGYSLSNPKNSSTTYPNNGVFSILLTERIDDPDTDAKPGFTLNLDPNVNYYYDDAVPEEHRVGKKIEIPSSGITDGARPCSVDVSWQNIGLIDGHTYDGTIYDSVQREGWTRYTFTVRYSEPIDPNVWRDADHNAGLDFGIYEDGSGDTSYATTNPCAVLDYVVHECEADAYVLMFNVAMQNEIDVTDDADGVDTLYAIPLVDESNAANRMAGVYDRSFNFAACIGTGNYTQPSTLAAHAYDAEPVLAGSVVGHNPVTAAGAMLIRGQVIGFDDEPVEPSAVGVADSLDNKWRIYAYSQKNLFRYSHTHQLVGVDTDNDGDYDRYDSVRNANNALSYDPNCMQYGKDDEVRAILAPTNGQGGQGGVCYGSAYLDPNGRYTMYTYGDMIGLGLEDGFQSSEAIFLVVESPVNYGVADGDSSTQVVKYLVTNGCKNDAPSFYIQWENGDYIEHNIDLTKWEKIPLTKGWNLVSFSTLKRYVFGNNPGTALQVKGSDGTWKDIGGVVKASSIDMVIPSLYDQWSQIFTVDPTKADRAEALRVTEPAKSSQLVFVGDGVEYFSIGNAYWINIPVAYDASLVVLGDKLRDNTNYRLPITVGVYGGWNMVGYWGERVVCTSYRTNNWFSSIFDMYDATCRKQVTHMKDAFWSFGTKFDAVRTFYLRDLTNGDLGKIAKSWYLPKLGQPEFNEITYIGPGYGYWVRITDKCDVMW